MNLKIKLDEQTVPKEYNKHLQKWENEGGPPVNARHDLDQIEAPLKVGQKFEVLSGKIVEEDGGIYYQASIKPL